MLRKSALAFAVFALLPVAEAQEKLVGGPVVVNVTTRNATVVWVMQGLETKLGTAPGELTATVPVLRAEKITYGGLKPGTTYHFEVPGRDVKGSFKTAPSGEQPFKFVVYGDTRTRHAVHQQVADAIAKAEPDFLIHTGDLVGDGTNPNDWLPFFSISKELFRNAAFFPVLGNHERNSPQYFEFFDQRKPYYSFRWGNAHFAMLDSDSGNGLPAEEREALWKEQVEWLDGDLERAANADFRFVVFHHPPFSAVKRRQEGAERSRGRTLTPLLEKRKVHVAFHGHDHNYQRHVMNGVHYVVAGGGGAPLYETDGPIPGITAKAVTTENFVLVTVEGKTARMTAYTPDGTVIEAVDVPSTADVPVSAGGR